MEITAVLGPSTGAHILREEPYALVVLANSNNYKTENHSRTVASAPLSSMWKPISGVGGRGTETPVLLEDGFSGCWRTVYF